MDTLELPVYRLMKLFVASGFLNAVKLDSFCILIRIRALRLSDFYVYISQKQTYYVSSTAHRFKRTNFHTKKTPLKTVREYKSTYHPNSSHQAHRLIRLVELFSLCEGGRYATHSPTLDVMKSVMNVCVLILFY